MRLEGTELARLCAKLRIEGSTKTHFTDGKAMRWQFEINKE